MDDFVDDLFDNVLDRGPPVSDAAVMELPPVSNPVKPTFVCVCVQDMDRVAMLHRRMRGAGGIGPMQPGMYGAGKKHPSSAVTVIRIFTRRDPQNS